MERMNTENLLLLEFLVDEVAFEERIRDDLLLIHGETCVTFQFLDNIPLCVTENEFTGNLEQIDKVEMKSGKSCLFSMTPREAEMAFNVFDIYLEVCKVMPPGTLPERILVGEGLISITRLYKKLMESFIKAGGSVCCAKSMEDTFKITSASTGNLVGSIRVFIRLSCFGKIIITEFQMNMQNKCIEFKKQNETCECNESEFLLGTQRSNKSTQDLGDTNECTTETIMQTDESLPIVKAPKSSPVNTLTSFSTSRETNKPYKAYGAFMGSNALTIKVMKDSKRREKALRYSVESRSSTMSKQQQLALEIENLEAKADMNQFRLAAGSCQLSNDVPNDQQLTYKTGPESMETILPNTQIVTCNQVANYVTPGITIPVPSPEVTDKEVFAFRVGKNRNGNVGGSELHIEMYTPKTLSNKMNQKYFQALKTIGTQYDLSELPDGYLENYYGKEIWQKILTENMQNESTEDVSKVHAQTSDLNKPIVISETSKRKYDAYCKNVQHQHGQGDCKCTKKCKKSDGSKRKNGSPLPHKKMKCSQIAKHIEKNPKIENVHIVTNPICRCTCSKKYSVEIHRPMPLYHEQSNIHYIN